MAGVAGQDARRVCKEKEAAGVGERGGRGAMILSLFFRKTTSERAMEPQNRERRIRGASGRWHFSGITTRSCGRLDRSPDASAFERSRSAAGRYAWVNRAATG